MDLPKIKADALPPVMMSRKGQFEMIPDFLQKKAVAKDLTSLGEMDMMQEALKKQEDSNANEGLSMKELFEKKRIDAEKKLEEAKIAGPTINEKEERKARLLAQRDLLRAQKEAKRQEELQTFKAKTETKEDLFSELKRMDENIKPKQDEEAARRLEQYRKLRKDMAQENKEENEDKYQKRLTEMDKKDKKKVPEVVMDDGDDWLKGMKTFGTDD